MNKILIIYPHFPPSNLAGIHRPRFFAQHLPEFGWQPTILTVHEKFYEESHDWNLVKLLPKDLRIEKVSAFNVSRPRIVGDIGLRAFFQLYKGALKVIKEETIDFIFIPIPSFYCALLGRMLKMKTGVPYGIDYIDPWVHQFPGSNKIFSRHWLSTRIAKLLEPIAVKNASLITGVAEGYYLPVLERNPKLRERAIQGAMPYGGEVKDHQALQELGIKPYLFQPNNKLQFVYAGAMLPKAFAPLKAICKAIAAHREDFEDVEFHFIGTGSRTNDPQSYNIKPIALEYGLWESIIFEYPKRIPYLDVLVHLDSAKAAFVLGSTEPHYTPSKVYQAVLSGKPLFAVLHTKSTAVQVIRESGSGVVLDFDGEAAVPEIEKRFNATFKEFRAFFNSFNPEQVDMNKFDSYSAKNVTRKLADLLNQVLDKNKR